MVHLTKPTILASHIDAACHLITFDGATVSAHVVIMAAEEIFREWYVKKNIYWRHDYRILVKQEYHREYLGLLRKKYNFFKHADRDIDEEIDVDIDALRKANELQLGILIHGYKAVFSQRTPTMETYGLWFLGAYPDLLDQTKIQESQPLLAFLKHAPTLSGAEKRQALRGLFYKEGILPRSELELFRRL